MLGDGTFTAAEEGIRVTTGDVRVWVVSQDGMTFGSGWSPDASGRWRGWVP